MHELAVAESLLELAISEAAKHQCNRLIFLSVEYGALSGIMPEALHLCFDALVKNSIHENAKLELVEKPLRLSCPLCHAEFGGDGQDAIWLPCPQCGEGFGHVVLQGKELILNRLEADRV